MTIWGNKKKANREYVCNQHFLLFPAMFSFPLGKTAITLVRVCLSSASSTNMEQRENVDCGIDLTLSQTTNLRLFQNGRVCRRHFQI